jgi:hypothetical protein
VKRFLAIVVSAAFAAGAVAAEKAVKPKVAKAIATAEFSKEGEPLLQSSGALVLDPATGHTLYSKNADHVSPIASITKVMTGDDRRGCEAAARGAARDHRRRHRHGEGHGLAPAHRRALSAATTCCASR